MLQAACPRRKIPAAPSLAPPNHVLTNEIHTARNGSQFFEAPVRVLVWRKLTKGDIDEPRWDAIIRTLLDRHGRLGNDSEWCWLLFAAMTLKINISDDVALNVVRNCG